MVSNGTNLGTKDHDKVGAAYLRNFGFPKNICQLVQGHVQAKRYLVWKYPDYHSSKCKHFEASEVIKTKGP
jgi:predicted HD phosphohydrolase